MSSRLSWIVASISERNFPAAPMKRISAKALPSPGTAWVAWIRKEQSHWSDILSFKASRVSCLFIFSIFELLSARFCSSLGHHPSILGFDELAMDLKACGELVASPAELLCDSGDIDAMLFHRTQAGPDDIASALGKDESEFRIRHGA